MSVSFPPFSTFSDALMAALASRSHEWTFWEISEKFPCDLSTHASRAALLAAPSLASAEARCRIGRPDGSFVEARVDLGSLPSPSATLEALLRFAPVTALPEFAALADWSAGALPRFESLLNEELPEFWRPGTAPEKLFFAHAKNSRGQYRQMLCPIF